MSLKLALVTGSLANGLGRRDILRVTGGTCDAELGANDVADDAF